MSRGLGRERGVDGRARTRRWRIDDGATAAAAEKDPTMTGAARTSPERQLRRFPRAYRLRDIAADRVEERLRLLAPGRGRHGARGCGPRGGTRRLDELRHRRVFRLTVGGFGNFSAPPKAIAAQWHRRGRARSTVSGRRGRRGRRAERSKMSCKCCGKPADPEDRRAKEMYAGPAFHLAPPPKPPAPRRLEHSWQHEWDASDRPPLYEAPKPNAFRPPPPAPRIPPAAAARMAGLDSPTVRAPTRDDDAREGDRADDGAAGATSPAGTADSAEAVRAALGLSPRSPGGRADAAGNPSSPAASGDVVEPKNALVSASRAFADAPANARNAAEWRASLALDPAKARQERQIGDLMASLGLNTRKKRRNLVYPDAFVASAAGTAGDDAERDEVNNGWKPLRFKRLSYPRGSTSRASARGRPRSDPRCRRRSRRRGRRITPRRARGVFAPRWLGTTPPIGRIRIGRRIVRRSLIRRMGFRGCRWAVVVTDGRCTSRGRHRGRAG